MLRVLDVYHKVAIQAGAAKACFMYWTCATRLQFELELPKSASSGRLALQNRDFRVEAAKARHHCKAIRPPPKASRPKTLGPSTGVVSASHMSPVT